MTALAMPRVPLPWTPSGPPGLARGLKTPIGVGPYYDPTGESLGSARGLKDLLTATQASLGRRLLPSESFDYSWDRILQPCKLRCCKINIAILLMSNCHEARLACLS